MMGVYNDKDLVVLGEITRDVDVQLRKIEALLEVYHKAEKQVCSDEHMYLLSRVRLLTIEYQKAVERLYDRAVEQAAQQPGVGHS